MEELPVVAMFVNGLELNEQSLERTIHGCFLPNFDSFGQTVTEEKIFQKSTNQKLGRKHPSSDPLTNMAVKGNSCF
jgi:hypothetical protein